MITPVPRDDGRFMVLRDALLAFLADIVKAASTTAGSVNSQDVLLKLLKAAANDGKNVKSPDQAKKFAVSLLVISSCFGGLSSTVATRITLAVRQDCESLSIAFADLADAFELLYEGKLCAAERSLKLALESLSRDRSKHWHQGVIDAWGALELLDLA